MKTVLLSKISKTCCVIILMMMMISNRSYSQNKVSLREAFINEILSDTFIGFGFLLPLKIKFKRNDTVYMWCDQTQFLFGYYRQRYKWDGNTFIKKLKPYVLNDRAWEVDSVDAEYFLTSIAKPLPEEKCNCVFNKADFELLRLPKDKKIPKGNSGEFACLVYNCSKRYLIVYEGEDDYIGIGSFDPSPPLFNELDGSRIDEKKSVEKH